MYDVLVDVLVPCNGFHVEAHRGVQIHVDIHHS